MRLKLEVNRAKVSPATAASRLTCFFTSNLIDNGG